MLVDARGGVLHHITFNGEPDRLVLPWHEIVRSIVACPCRGVILLHSHPSADAAPSAADIRVTRRLALMLSPLDVKLCDHLIVAERTHFSFREAGLV